MTTGERIKDIRKKLGITQKELAQRMGVKDPVISQYETGIRKPKYDTILRFAEALETSPYSIIGFDERAPEGMADTIKTNIMQYGTHFLKLMDYYTMLNESGQLEAVKRISELAELPRYQKRTDEQEEGNNHDEA